MNYLVPAGLYAIGEPTAEAPVVVTANYKMSFDLVRRELSGRNVFLLVLETFGINVWCAAGKGSFGTDELVQRIASSGLARVVYDGLGHDTRSYESPGHVELLRRVVGWLLRDF